MRLKGGINDVKKVIAAWEDYEYEALLVRSISEVRPSVYQALLYLSSKTEAEKKAPDDFVGITVIPRTSSLRQNRCKM